MSNGLIFMPYAKARRALTKHLSFDANAAHATLVVRLPGLHEEGGSQSFRLFALIRVAGDGHRFTGLLSVGPKASHSA